MKIKEQKIDDVGISGLEIYIRPDVDDGWELTLIPKGPFQVAQRDLCFTAGGELGDVGSFLNRDMLKLHELLYTVAKNAYKFGREEQRPDSPELEEKLQYFAWRNAELLYKDLSEKGN